MILVPCGTAEPRNVSTAVRGNPSRVWCFGTGLWLLGMRHQIFQKLSLLGTQRANRINRRVTRARPFTGRESHVSYTEQHPERVRTRSTALLRAIFRGCLMTHLLYRQCRNGVPYGPATRAQFHFLDEGPERDGPLSEVVWVADYTCPIGRHDVAMVFPTGYIDPPALNCSSREARCLARALALSGEFVTGGARTGAPPPPSAFTSLCSDNCDLVRRTAWLACVVDDEGEYLVQLGFELANLPSFAVNMSVDEALLLASALMAASDAVDDQNDLVALNLELRRLVNTGL